MTFPGQSTEPHGSSSSHSRPRWLFIVLSFSFALLVGAAAVAIWNWNQSEPASLMFNPKGGDYELSFVTTHGLLVSDRVGPLRLMMDPFSFYRVFPNNQTQSYSIDRFGFRGDNQYDKPIIFVVGGSAAFGWGLPSDQSTFSALLEQRLEGRVEVINAGVPGFLSGQELSQIVHRLDPFHPVGYLIFDGWNDLGNQYNQDWLLRRWPQPDNPDMGFNIQFDVFQRRLHTYWAQATDGVEPQDPFAPKPELDDRYFDRIADTYLSNIEKMNAFARSRGASVAVCVQPEVAAKQTRTTKEDNIVSGMQTRLQYLDRKVPQRYVELTERVEKLCRDRSIPFAAAGATDKVRQEPETIYYDVVHLNERGQEVIADIVLEAGLLDEALGSVQQRP